MVQGPGQGPGLAGAEDPGIWMKEHGEGWKTPENEEMFQRGGNISSQEAAVTFLLKGRGTH